MRRRTRRPATHCAPLPARKRCRIGWDFVRASYSAVSRLAVVTLPDLLSLGTEGRFNTPGRPDGNWQWRYRASAARHLFGETTQYRTSSPTFHAGCPKTADSEAGNSARGRYAGCADLAVIPGIIIVLGSPNDERADSQRRHRAR